MSFNLSSVELRVTADNDHVTGANQMGCGPVNADNSRIGSAFNGVRRQTIAIRDVINLNLFVLNDVRQAPFSYYRYRYKYNYKPDRN